MLEKTKYYWELQMTVLKFCQVTFIRRVTGITPITVLNYFVLRKKCWSKLYWLIYVNYFFHKTDKIKYRTESEYTLMTTHTLFTIWSCISTVTITSVGFMMICACSMATMVLPTVLRNNFNVKANHIFRNS